MPVPVVGRPPGKGGDAAQAVKAAPQLPMRGFRIHRAVPRREDISRPAT